MKTYFGKLSKSYEDTSSNDREVPNAAGEKNKENKNVKNCIENTSPGKPCDVDDENDTENEVKVVEDLVNFPEFDSRLKVGQGKFQDDDMETKESAVSSAEISASKFDSNSSDDSEVTNKFNNSKFHDGFTDIETGHQVPKKALNVPTATPHRGREYTIIIEPHILQRNPAILNKAGNETNDPTLLVRMKLNIEEKEKLCKNEPCQPPESILSERKKKIGEHNQYCSQAVFFHEDQTRRKWLSYSLTR